MTFLIGGANSLADTGYDIDNSCRFDDGSSSTLEINLAESANASRRTFTWSAWVKRGNITGAVQTLYSTGSGDDDFDSLSFDANDNLRIFCRNAGSTSATLITNAKYRDVSAWYHIVMRIDTTQGTEANRLRLYVNGEEPSLGTATYTTQNKNLLFNTTFDNSFIGCQKTNTTSLFFDGYIAEIHNVSAASLGPGSFGETNDNGVWIPKDCKDDLTYGTNGYYLEFKGTGTSADSSGIGADTSGNDQHFSLNNIAATDVTTDTPTNNFCTMNPLDVGSDLRDNGSFAEGNLEVTNGATSGQADQQRVRGTIAVTKGKWYFEMKQIANSASIGVLATEAAHGGTSANSMLVEYNDGGEIRFFNGSGRTTKTTGIDSFDDDDIVGCALDMDNRRAYFHKNGTYQGDPTPDPAGSPSGAGQFGGIQTGFTMAPCMFDNSSGSAGKGSFNFGNAPFAISSGNSDGAGFGNFEYAVPSGYFSLCTKNLATYG